MKQLYFVSCILFWLNAMSQPTTGLVAHYTFSGNANDVSGNGNNGVIHGATLVADQFGNVNNAYLFNGSSDYIDIPAGSFLLNNYTYSICIKPTANPPSSNIRAFLDFGNSTADQHVAIANTIPYPLGFGFLSYYSTVNTADLAIAGSLPPLNTYYHIVATRSNSYLKLYVNGIIVDSVIAHGAPNYGTGAKQGRIGCRVGNSQFFQGVIDDVAIYNRVLTDAEIQSYSCTASPNSGLVGCYPLDNNANDYSGNNYNGTAHGLTPTTDRFGNANSAYHFSGSSSYVGLPTTGYLLNEYSYSLWCRPTNLPPLSGGAYCLMAIGNNVADQHILVNNTPIPYVGFGAGTYNSSGTGNACYNGTLPTINQWYHVVMTRNNTTMKLYVNGVLGCSVNYSNANAGYLNLPAVATIGSRLDAFTQLFQGDIDDVRIYNRVLTQSEIQNMPASCNCSVAVNLGPDTITCNGNSITLNAGSTGTSYHWYSGNNPLPNDTLQTYQPSQSGTYSVVVDNGVCTATDTVHIDFQPVYTITVSPVTSCGNYILPWGTTAVSTNNYSHIYSPNGCDSIITIPVTINPEYNIVLNPVASCDTFALPWGGSATTTNNYSHTYNSIYGCDSIVNVHVTINHPYNVTAAPVTACDSSILPWGGYVVTTNNYVHTYSSVSGCDSTVSIQITVNPSYHFSSPHVISCGQYILPWGSIAITTGIYTHSVQTIYGCDSTRSVNVTINYIPQVTAFSNSPVCEGDSLLLNSTTDTVVGFNWTGPNGFHSHLQNPILTNFILSDTGIYTLHAGSPNGCSPLPIQMHVISANTKVNVTGSDPLCLGDTLLFKSDYIPNAVYNWTGPNGFSSHLQNPVVLNLSPLDSGNYSLYITTTGCSSDTSFIHEGTVISSIDQILLPNVFSPNNDSKNDLYYLADVEDFEMKIFNRWGQELITLSPSKKIWDGTFSGKAVPEGMYFYILKGSNCKGEPITRTGNISLFR